MATALAGVVAEELGRPVDPRVGAMAAALAARYPGAGRAVLFYGSCLRQDQLAGLMLDFYLIVSDYAAAYGQGWYALANRLLPPNVFPFSHSDQDGDLIAKYAVLSEGDFARLCSRKAGDVSVWARFAQPTRLVWAADENARGAVVAAVAEAPVTMAWATLPLVDRDRDRDSDPLALWRSGFALTYGAELRAERGGRAASIVDFDPDYYRRLSAALTADHPRLAGTSDPARLWCGFRRRGKALTLARLAKATTTYAGGIDYLAWKVNRHAGTAIALKPWQRRWPIIGALSLLPRLLRSGAIR